MHEMHEVHEARGLPYWRRSALLMRTIAGDGPAICTLQVTNRCNMRCSFCAFWSDGAPPPEELTLAQLARVSERLAQAGSFILSVEGGEPMLRPDLVDIVALLARHHHPVLYTNGWFLDALAARALCGAGLVGAGVSIDYATPARHDAHRLPGSFDRAVAAVQHLLAVASVVQRRQIHLMTVLMDDNREELEPLLQLSARLGVRHRVTLLALSGHNRAGGKTQPATGVTSWLQGLRRRYPHFAGVGDYIDRMDDYLAGAYTAPCQAGRRGFNINHLGQTNPCIELTDVSVGHFLDGPFDDLLARLRIAPSVEGCQRCYTVCRGNVQALARPLKIRSLAELLR
ncbi:MAG: radical SAM protein [Myxococcales bacterium]|nr:radical SAM protein [Myxococcales bacterium]